MDETGRGILVYSSGARKWEDNGQWLNGPTSADYNPIIADPRGMQKRGQELARQRAQQAINDAAGEAMQIDLSQAGDNFGWYALVKHTAEVYLKSSNIRGMGEVLGKLGTAAGYLSRDGETRPAAPPGGITATPEAIRALMEILQEEIDRRVEQAKAIAGEEV